MLPVAPPTVAQANAALRRGSTGWPTYALQAGFNDAGGGSLNPDGVFGHATEIAVRDIQRVAGISVDGVYGPVTRKTLAARVYVRLERELTALPNDLVGNLGRGESGSNSAAVNWLGAGGVDCGLWQMRVLGPPFRFDILKVAFSPYRSGRVVLLKLIARAQMYATPHRSCPFTRIELAVLGHNWPWAADRYYRYGRLPDPNRPAPWVPASLPASARTYDGWAHYYVQMMT